MAQNASFSSRHSAACRHCPQSLLFGMIGALAASTVVAQEDADKPLTFRDKFVQQVVQDAELTGELGIFDFRRFHDTNRPYPNVDDPENDFNTRSNAFGGSLSTRTGMIYGVSAEFGISFAEPIVHYDNPNLNLVGPDEGLYAITKGYVQYNRPGLRLRGGRQLLNTPFANTDQFTLIPRSFSGFSAAIRPLQWNRPSGYIRDEENGYERIMPPDYTNNQYMPFEFDASVTSQPTWQIFIARMTSYQSRFNDEFTHNNRYVEDTPGLFTVGTTVRRNTAGGDYLAQIWHYTFFDTARLQYAELGYQMPVVMGAADWGGFEPYIRVQFAQAEETGRAALGEVDAQIYGLKFGVQSRHSSAALVAHYSPLNEGSFRDGQLVHPYSDLSGVFYTDTMNNGVDGLGPGYGIGGRLDIRFSDNVDISTRYVYYQAKRGQSHAFYNVDGDRGFAAGIPIVEGQNSWGWDTGITVDLGVFSAHLEGFRLQNILGITDFDGSKRFYNNRLRLLYQF
ncbi:hypothetical protein CWE12_00545 [Aliidiomarina sedimenti]|uniref:Outer membrane porin, OprD family n=1 Tax=Aliidiomarina sedimenti TaxID=1933879 RepID=A0ABY0C0Z0_9GAMM|nr:hypothetical protein [Aliidiomarina sedimenti]RUO31527.1 hypothetical protein CWE12_00545 [Aliidiomarina sedimenti]